MLMIKWATFGMCCFPLCIVSAPTTRSMHPVCMYIQYVYTLSIYICIYIYILILFLIIIIIIIIIIMTYIYIYMCMY